MRVTDGPHEIKQPSKYHVALDLTQEEVDAIKFWVENHVPYNTSKIPHQVLRAIVGMESKEKEPAKTECSASFRCEIDGKLVVLTCCKLPHSSTVNHSDESYGMWKTHP